MIDEPRSTPGSAPIAAQWVTKSDIRSYRICPYAFWLIDTGAVDLTALLERSEGAVDKARIDAGVAFEAEVLAGMPAIPPGVKPEEIGVRYLFNVPTFCHEQKHIAGRPDGIDLDYHAPIEIKHHRIPYPFDYIELAFYWILLERRRKHGDVAPFGYLHLVSRDERTPQRLVKLELRPSHFAEVDRLIAAVRTAREHGVKPRECDCLVCATRPEVRAIIEAGEDIRRLWGVGRQHAQTLYRLGVNGIVDLISADPVDLAGRMRSSRENAVSPLHIVSWQHHARALTQNAVIRFAPGHIKSERYVALDIEYDLMGPIGIWLIGALYRATDGTQELFQRFCPTRAMLRKALDALSGFLVRHRDVPVVTYSGTNADLPRLRAATRRRRLIDDLYNRHIDLYAIVTKAVRFPAPDHGLKSITGHLGVVRTSKIADGLQALALFETWRRSRSTKMKARHRQRLLKYNREDLEGTVALIEYLRTLDVDPHAQGAHRLVLERCAELKREKRRLLRLRRSIE